MSVLGIIPARGGSKGIPNKNLRELAGKPLLAYTLEAANASGVIDRLVLSTDSQEIAELGRKLGLEIPFLRPAELAADDSPMLAVAQHAVGELERQGWRADIIVLLQPTSPLRRGGRVRKAVELLESKGCDSVVSVVEIPDLYSPQKAMKVQDGFLVFLTDGGKAITRRQQVVSAYAREGTVYACRRDVLMERGSLYGEKCLPLIISRGEALSLDTMVDWQRAEEILGARAAQPVRT
ncbi:MAG: acylneuraminate cytidylyltransferase family protein [Anaerolineales bacterium]